MSEHREAHLDLCAGLALGSLDPADRREIEAHLSEGCPVCEKALADFSGAVVLLASSAGPAQPSATLRERVLAAARAEAQARGITAESAAPERGRIVELPRRRGAPFFTWGLAAAAAALLAVSAITWNETRRLNSELESNRSELAQLRQQIEEERHWAAVLNSPQAQQVAMAPTPAGSPALRARATYDPTTHSAVLVFENFRPPTAHDYELWAIRAGKPVALGLIRTDQTGHAVLRFEDVGDPASLNAFAVSLEPEGGSARSDTPSGPVVMLGKLGG